MAAARRFGETVVAAWIKFRDGVKRVALAAMAFYRLRQPFSRLCRMGQWPLCPMVNKVWPALLKSIDQLGIYLAVRPPS
ncbi:MAG: hypothetical protein WCG00_12600 [Hyphomicrobiales bacterium]